MRPLLAAIRYGLSPPGPGDQPLVAPVAGGVGALLRRRDRRRLASVLDPAAVQASKWSLNAWLERRQARCSTLLLLPDRATAMRLARSWRLDLARVRLAPDLAHPSPELIASICNPRERHVARSRPWYAR